MLRLVLLALLLGSAPANAALVLLDDGFAGYGGTGLVPGGGAGTLDSVLWSVTGASDGDTGFGGLVDSGDLARGASPGGVRAGGLYAFDLPGGLRGLGIQPTSSDFTPGALVRAAQNATGEWLASLLVEAKLWVLNDGPRSTRVTLDATVDGGAWQRVPDAVGLTPAAADATGWQPLELSATLAFAPLAPGAALALRLGFDDASGDGARDELALSALRVTGTPIPAPAASLPAPGCAWLLLAGLGLLPMVNRLARAR